MPEKVMNFAQALRLKHGSLREAEPVHYTSPSVLQPSPLSEPIQGTNPFEIRTPPYGEPVQASQGNPSTAEETTRPTQTRSNPEPVRRTEGFMQITNHLLDDILPTLEPHEQIVLLRLYRLSRGHRNAFCKVSLPKLVSTTRVKKTKLREAIATLVQRGLIKRLQDDVSNPDIYDRGMHFEMLLEGPDPIRRPDPSGTRTRSQGGHIKEGIKNKDSKEGAAPPDFQNCPDCTGTGFYYPNGHEGGVAKCKHEKLKQ